MFWPMLMFTTKVMMWALFILPFFQIWWDRQRQPEQRQHQNQPQHQEEQQCRGGPRRPPPQNLLFPLFILSPHPGNLRWPILFKEFIGINQMIIKGWDYIFSFYCQQFLIITSCMEKGYSVWFCSSMIFQTFKPSWQALTPQPTLHQVLSKVLVW